MALPKWLWKGEGGEESPASQEAETSEATSTPATSRMPRRSPTSVSPRAIPGPSATLFEKTVGGSVSTGAHASVVAEPVDRQFDEVIMNTLDQDSKEPGFKEFMAQFKALSNVITDKGQCAAASLIAVTAAHPKIDAMQITRAIGERIALLGTFTTSYNEECAKSQEAETREKGNAIGEAEARIKELDVDLARIVSEKAQVESEMQRLESDLAGVNQKYDGFRGRFQATVNARREELKRFMSFVAPSGTK